MWLRFDPTTLWHSDAAEWAPSTASFTSLPARAKIGLFPLCSDTVENDFEGDPGKD